MMITLYGLTKQQRKLADKIWSNDFNDYSELGNWLLTLTPKKQKDAVKLIELFKIEMLDQMCDEMDDTSEAEDVIGRIMRMK